MKVSIITAATVAAAALLGACADGSLSGLTTSSVSGTPTTVSKVDPACATLTTQISSLRSEGIADKVEKAAIKKYKMTPADLAKADQLNKANADFQAKCSSVPQQTAAADPAATAAGAAATQAATQAGTAAAAKATAAAKQ